MRSRIASAALAVLLATPVTLHAQPRAGEAAAARRKVAVLRLDFAGNISEAGRDLFSAQLKEGLAAGNFDVLGRAAVEAQLETTELANCRTPECLPRVARALGVDFLVVGSVNENSKTYALRVELVAAETGTLAVTSRERCETCGIEEAAEKMALAASALRARLEAMSTTPARLIVRSKPEGATVLLDDRPVGTTPLDLEVAAGQHTLSLSARGHLPSERTVTAVGGVDEDVVVQLVAEPSQFPLRTVGWVSVATGLAAVAGGLYALSLDGREISCSKPEMDPQGHCPYVRDTGTWAAVLVGLGATALTLGGVSLYIARDRDGHGSEGTSVGLVGRGRF